MKITTWFRKIFLGYDGLDKKVQASLDQMDTEKAKTNKQIVAIKTKIEKTQTYYFGKAAGVIIKPSI